jgi:TonB family protein
MSVEVYRADRTRGNVTSEKQDPSPGSGATTDQKAPDWFNGAEVLPQPGVTPPTVVRRARPVYPASAMSADVTGEVELDARVEVDGHVSNVRILRSIPPLDASAEEAAEKPCLEMIIA